MNWEKTCIQSDFARKEMKQFKGNGPMRCRLRSEYTAGFASLFASFDARIQSILAVLLLLKHYDAVLVQRSSPYLDAFSAHKDRDICRMDSATSWRIVVSGNIKYL